MVTPDPAEVQRAVGARYEVLDLVGAGGMGAVYRARHKELGHLVAIKVLPPEIAASQVREERFRREAQLAAQLSHPNVVPVYEFETREGLTYLIMPFVRGRTLETLLAERARLPLPNLLRVLRDVGAALDFLHPRGVVHRDVKPANILIEDEANRALLTDFGIALARVSGAGSLTVPGAYVGTPAYMAPEQMSAADRVDGRADLYALALVAYESLAGELPGAGVDLESLAAELHAVRPDVSAATAHALVAPLAENPLQRPQSAAAWLLGIERSTQRSWRRPAIAAAAIVVLGIAAWIGFSRLGNRPPAGRSLAVMPFSILGTSERFPPAQLPAWFLRRLGSVPHLEIISAASVASLTGGEAPAITQAESLAVQLGATYFVLPSLELRPTTATLSADIYRTRSGKHLAPGKATGPPDSLSALMDAVWAQLLRPVMRESFAPISSVTMPHNLAAMTAYANAEEAFRSGDFATALDEYNRVVRADSTFALAYFRRAVVIAQIDPRPESFTAAIAGARQHQLDLTPADSLLLDGYRQLLERGDGRTAVRQFRKAAELAPDEPQAWFALAEFYYYLGALFGDSLAEAEAAFDKVLEVSPNYAPAISNLISLAHLRGDKEETRRLITAYQAFGTTSVVSEVIGVVDTLLFHALPARAALLKTLGNHSFTALEYLAFQAQEFGTPAERTGPGREVLRALQRRATTDSQEVLALRMGVAADLREGWVDSARARITGVRTPATEHERDMWIVLARAAGLDSLGVWRTAAARLDRDPGNDAFVHWMLARLGYDSTRHVAAVGRLAADSAPLPLSLKLDLEARRAVAAGDTARALALWQQATERYAVVRVPFDLAASLWWLRLDLARLALAHRDTALAARTCDGFEAPIGYVDLVVWPQAERFCKPLHSIAVP